MPATDQALAKLCPDLQSWPQSWRYDDTDIALGERLVECFTSFMVHLLGQKLSSKTVVLPHVTLLPAASRELLPDRAIDIEPLPTSQIRRWIS